jgi:8-amino-7-oxononanoate synthase
MKVVSESDSMAWIDAELRHWSDRGLKRSLRVTRALPGARIEIEGRQCVNYGSNDYLGLATNERVVEAACRAARDEGWGAAGAPFVSGWRRPHQDLIEAIADFEGAEAALLFPTGFAANTGTMTALVGRGDAVYLDRLAHASLVAGARMSGASVRIFPHNDSPRLDEILARERSRFRRVLIATEGLFSMDGDTAPLEDLAAVCEIRGAMLLVDEAHSTGVLGARGEGACGAFGVCNRVSVRVGTLSKALGSMGGFVVGDRRVIDLVKQRAASFVFSTSMPAAAAAAASMALDIVSKEPQRRAKLAERGAELRARTGTKGPVGSPIVPWVLGEPERAVRVSKELYAQGIWAPAIRPPTVPRETSRLRISVTAVHSALDIAQLCDVLEQGAARFSRIDPAKGQSSGGVEA